MWNMGLLFLIYYCVSVYSAKSEGRTESMFNGENLQEEGDSELSETGGNEPSDSDLADIDVMDSTLSSITTTEVKLFYFQFYYQNFICFHTNLMKNL